ncbi:MAG: hypothetical protein KDI09_13130 [Halioglobus sp.]|nr:hypothetical protein [Halioglobus sp.]
MHLIFVHGWSVTHTNTYGSLPESLSSNAAASGLSIEIRHIHLGRYISFHDDVSMDDIAHAFDTALRDLPGNEREIQAFSCITHSTGGPVVRHWVETHYGARRLSLLPLKHLVMLAPANHGSALATLGKARVGRIKAWFNGVEPGQRVLDWLCLGSDGQWSLNEAALAYRNAHHGFYPFVLTGQGIDTHFYDFLNGYLVEPGSDGVVRVAGANMNFRYLALTQGERELDGKGLRRELTINTRRPVRFSPAVPTGVFSTLSHSGNSMGIMAVRPKAPEHARIVAQVMGCLAVTDADTYARRARELAQLTAEEQSKVPEGKREKIGRYSMLVFRVRDQHGDPVKSGDFDILLLGGDTYSANRLPPGFFVDKQLNRQSHSLVYYVDADKMCEMPDGLYGIRVTARPEAGFSYYVPGEFRSQGIDVDKVFAPNQTTYIDITLTRHVDKNVFRFSGADQPRKSFKRTAPSGEPLGEPRS